MDYRDADVGIVAAEDLHEVEHSLARRGERFVTVSVGPGTGVVFE